MNLIALLPANSRVPGSRGKTLVTGLGAVSCFFLVYTGVFLRVLLFNPTFQNILEGGFATLLKISV